MTNPSKPLENGERDASGKFLKGHKGGPGRARVRPEVAAALEADTLEHYAEAKRLIALAEKDGDLKTALDGRLKLLKKTVPDATELVVSLPDGLTVRTLRIDPKRLTAEQLKQLHALYAEAAKEG